MILNARLKNRLTLQLLAVFFIFIFSANSTPVYAQNSFDGLELFDDKTILDAKIVSDFKFLRKEKFKSAYQPAFFTIYFANGDSATTEVRIKARGKFRRKHCLFPPFKIKFKKDEFGSSSVAEFNSLKLVTHCRPQAAYSQRLHEEYLIYKMYESLTEFSFKTRMFRINYIDSGSKSDPGWFYGFLLEDIDQVAQRNNSIEIEPKSIHPERTNRYLSTLMPLFQYMIGNTDWSSVYFHNIKLIKQNDPTLYAPITIPYDFDYCGLLDAPYAIPPEKLELADVTTRYYRGFCRSDEEFQEVFDLLIEHKDEFMNLISSWELLDERTKKDDLFYLEKFYNIIEDPKMVNKTIKLECQRVDSN